MYDRLEKSQIHQYLPYKFKYECCDTILTRHPCKYNNIRQEHLDGIQDVSGSIPLSSTLIYSFKTLH